MKDIILIGTHGIGRTSVIKHAQSQGLVVIDEPKEPEKFITSKELNKMNSRFGKAGMLLFLASALSSGTDMETREHYHGEAETYSNNSLGHSKRARKKRKKLRRLQSQARAVHRK